MNDKTNIFARYSTDHFAQTFPNGVQVAANGQLGAAFNSITAPNSSDRRTAHLHADFHNRRARRATIANIVSITREATRCCRTAVLDYRLLESRATHPSDRALDNVPALLTIQLVLTGHHTIKFGVQWAAGAEIRLHRMSISRACRILAKQNFHNIMDSYSSSNQAPVTGQRQTETFAYILDQFQVRPNLTINAGLRYEYYGIDHEVNGRAIVVDPYTCGQPLVCPNGSAWYNPDPRDLAPRLSLAWSPERFEGKTVIRAGAGIYYGQGQFGHLGGPIGNLASNFTLNLKQVPGLSYPVTPFLGAAAYSVSYVRRRTATARIWRSPNGPSPSSKRWRATPRCRFRTWEAKVRICGPTRF